MPNFIADGSKDDHGIERAEDVSGDQDNALLPAVVVPAVDDASVPAAAPPADATASSLVAPAAAGIPDSE